MDSSQLFFETLRFANLEIIHAKRYKKDCTWNINGVLNANELYYIINGEMRIITNEQSYKVPEKHMVFLPANIYREAHIAPNTTIEFYSLQFLAEAGGIAYTNYLAPVPPVNLEQHASKVDSLMNSLSTIGEPQTHSDIFKRLGLAGELLSILFAVANPQTKLSSQKSHINFSSVMSYIERYYRFQTINISQLAAMLNISERYFRREFKREFGISCKMYINSMRMEGVLKLLRESNESIKSIADLYQYSDGEYLSKAVKKATGISPSDYRKLHKNKQ